MTENKVEYFGNGGVVFAGPLGVRLYVATALNVALRVYASRRIKVNTNWTPTNMIKMATKITGKAYGSRDYIKAADDVKAWCDATAAQLAMERHDG